MGRKYKIYDEQDLYFLTFTVVEWMEVFHKEKYKAILYESLKYCISKKKLNVHSFCVMPNHVHFIWSIQENEISRVIRDFKSFTSRSIRKIMENEISAYWKLKLEIMLETGKSNSRNKDFQFWQQHNHPILLDSNELIDSRINYIHQNPVKAGFVFNEEEWVDSSACVYADSNFCEIPIVKIE